MVEHNIWFWFLEAIARQVFGLVARVPAHQYWGWANSVVGYTAESSGLMISFLGLFIGFRQLEIVVGIILTFESILWAKRLVVNNLGTILKLLI